MDLKLERNVIYAIIIVFLLSLGFWSFPAKTTLPEFGAATQIRSAMRGGAVPLHISTAASAAAMTGASAENPQSIAAFLLNFSPLLLALTALFLYLALRAFGFGKTPSAFSSLLFPLSLSALPFLPGVYGSMQLAAPFLSLFLLFFALFAAKKEQLMLVPAILFAAISSYFNAAFGIAGIAAVVSFGAAAYLKGDKRLARFTMMLLVFAAALYLSPEKQQTYFSLSAMGSVLSLTPFLLAASSAAAVLFFLSSGPLEYFLLFLSGAFVSIFSPAAGAILLVLPCASGISSAIEEKLHKAAKLSVAFFIAFFAFIGISMAAGADIYKSAAIAALLSILAPLSLHFYEYRSHRLLPAFALALLVISASTALFYQLPPQREQFPTYLDKDLSSALSSLSGKGEATISIIGSQDAARFYVPSAQFVPQQDVSSFLLSGAPKPPAGSFLILSISYLDDSSLSSEGFETFYYSNNFSSGASYYALFFSPSGRLVAREIGTDGSLSLKDGVLLDGSGSSYGSVPLSRMLLLKSSQPFSDKGNRMMVLEEGSGLPHFMKIYSGTANELGEKQEYGKVSVYSVN